MVVLETFDNAVGFWNWKRISPTVVMFFGYLFINVVYTVKKEPVYPILIYTDWISYAFVVGMVGLVVLVYYILMLFTRFYKKGRIERLLGRQL